MSGPTEKECEALLLHVVGVGVAETKSDPPPTDDERKAVAAELAPQLLPGCQKGTRAAYQCALDAKTLAAVGACGTK